MIYKYQNSVGVDREIEHLQDWIYSKLTVLGYTDYECYGRAFLNPNPRIKDKKEFQIAIDGKEYIPIMPMDDKHLMQSFFHLKGVTHKDLAEAKVVLFFGINIKKEFDNTSRHDEDTILDIMSVIHVNPPSFQLGEVKRGVKDVFSEYNIDVQERDNISEYLVCSFDLTVTYIHEHNC
jgi:hypothetical protein